MSEFNNKLEIRHLWERCLDASRTYLDAAAIERLNQAYIFATDAHAGQKRKSGRPYIVHPIHVAIALAELRQDCHTICAGLLHDTLEDCAVSYSDLTRQFGEDVAILVEGVTNLGRMYLGTRAQAENLRKLFLAMAKDSRVVFIKLADRLHNMQTVQFLSESAQQRMALETQDIFAPLAHRLGLWSIKWQLHDLAFATLEPTMFKKIQRLVVDTRATREAHIQRLVNKIKQRLDPLALSYRIMGRPKHMYSIYQKLKRRDMDYTRLHDVLGLRIIVTTIPECYTILGHAHELFKPIPGRFKDYIAVPKPNLYQSLHTSVVDHRGVPIEIQIRTERMHQIAEYGLAAHWHYKLKDSPEKIPQPQASAPFLQELVDYNEHTPVNQDNADQFLDHIKLDLLVDEVMVFTPTGDVLALPQHATPLDFAYKIHTDVGHTCIGAKVNDCIVPLRYELQHGDRVEIMRQANSKPKKDWLLIVQTEQARHRIRQWFRRHEPEPTPVEDDARPVASKPIKHQKSTRIPSESPRILLSGHRSVEFRLAKCCAPNSGDPIVGYPTIANGLSIHRRNCRMIQQLSDDQQARILSAKWESDQPWIYLNNP
ncbi:(p)ppGpp synthetase [bacterium]|nr:(p)ppGpp synthetase [bacterium]